MSLSLIRTVITAGNGRSRFSLREHNSLPVGLGSDGSDYPHRFIRQLAVTDTQHIAGARKNARRATSSIFSRETGREDESRPGDRRNREGRGRGRESPYIWSLVEQFFKQPNKILEK